MKSNQAFPQINKREKDSSIVEVNTILESEKTREDKIVDILTINLEQQEASSKMMQHGFVGLAVQNNELQQKLEEVQEQLSIVTKELEERKKKN